MPHFVFVVRPGGTRSLGMFVGRILGVFAVFPPSVYLEWITQGGSMSRYFGSIVLRDVIFCVTGVYSDFGRRLSLT